MENAAAHFIGTYDFITFQASGGKKLESTVRTIYSAKIHEARTPDLTENPDAPPNAVILEITGDGFLYNMVRIIAGTLVDVGLNKIEPDRIPDLIAGKSRQLAGHTAPPQGLYLAEVFYKKEKMYETEKTTQSEC